jgi:hypothetical protein
MKDIKITREEFEKKMKDYKSGKRGIQPGHPKEIEEAIKSFLELSYMMVEYPEINTIPSEYVENLLVTLSKYPQYNKLTLELLDILKLKP